MAIGFARGGVAGQAEMKVLVVGQMTEIRTLEDLDAAAKPETLRLVGPRNGYCSGQVVVTSPRPGRLRATVSNLTGPGTIPAEGVLIRYAGKAHPPPLEFGPKSEGSDPSVLTPYYDILYAEPPAGAKILPVWLTVQVPDDAPPGAYSGTLTVGGVEVPVALRVGAWLCPDPNEWLTHVGLLSSPETLAVRYGGELWSEQHWQLVEQELQLMAGLGSDDLWLSVLPGNSLGQERPWITFKNTDAGCEPDFAIAERYMDLYAKHVGKPEHVIVYLYEPGHYGHAYKKRSDETGLLNLTVGEGVEKLPMPAAAGSEGIWRPLMDGIRARVLQRGWSEDSILLGCGSDVRPAKGTVDFFKKHAPYARWAIWTHGRDAYTPEGQRSYDILSADGKMAFKNGLEVAYYSFVDAPSPSPGDRSDGIQGGWDLAFKRYFSFRNYLAPYTHLEQWRTLPDAAMVTRRGQMHVLWAARADAAGFAFLPLDFWPVHKNGPLLSKHWRAFRGLMRNNSQWLAAPGPDGPLATVRYEMLREGLQECEARIALEKALAAGAVPEDMSAAARALLAERIKVRTKGGTVIGGHTGNKLAAEKHLWGVAPDWQDSAAKLFDMAGKAAAQ